MGVRIPPPADPAKPRHGDGEQGQQKEGAEWSLRPGVGELRGRSRGRSPRGLVGGRGGDAERRQETTVVVRGDVGAVASGRLKLGIWCLAGLWSGVVEAVKVAGFGDRHLKEGGIGVDHGGAS
ncbi:MAG: hypothetical protein ACYDGR_09350 [Candidatus Dormibacteria bacterium]